MEHRPVTLLINIFLLTAMLSIGGCARDQTAAAFRRLAAGDLGSDLSADLGSGCGIIGAVGCCKNKTTLHYCAAGKITAQSCTNGRQCGWSATYGLYACGVNGGADPKGTFPYSCPLADAAPDGPAADAPAGDLAAVDAQAPDSGSCAGLGYAGCCQGKTLYFCSGGKILSLSCIKSPSCGWNKASGFYDCSTPGKADPSGKNPMKCLWLADAGGAPDGLSGDSGTPDQFIAAADMTGPASDALVDIMGANDGFTIVPDTLPHVDGPPIPDQRPAEQGPGVDVSGFEGGTEDFGGTPSTPVEEGCGCRTSGGGGYISPVLPLLGLFLFLLRRRRASAGFLALFLFVTACQDRAADTGSLTLVMAAGDQGASDAVASDAVASDAVASDAVASDAAGHDAPMSCGAVPSIGCCDGETLWWCQAGKLKSMSCRKRLRCGWSGSGRYDCNTSGAADPKGKYSQHCRALTGDSGFAPCDAGATDGGSPCGGITLEGCCKGNTLLYCVEGKLKIISCSLNPSCGWHPGGQLYDCGTQGKADPKKAHAKACPASLPGDLRLDGPILPDKAVADLTGPDLGGDGGGIGDDGCSLSGRHSMRSPLTLLLCGLAYWAWRRRLT